MIHRHWWWCKVLNKLGFHSDYRISNGKKYTTWTCMRCLRQHRERYFPTVPLSIDRVMEVSQEVTAHEKQCLHEGMGKDLAEWAQEVDK